VTAALQATVLGLQRAQTRHRQPLSVLVRLQQAVHVAIRAFALASETAELHH
jgi:hypothetical protein